MARREGATSSGSPRAGRLALAVAAARRYHLDGQTKVQIAAELGVSRFKVARLLDEARAAGLVQISVGMPPEIDAGLSEELRAAFGLRQALVVSEESDGVAAARESVAQIAAGLLEHLVSADDIVGLAWGRTMSSLAAAWSEPVPATFVQMAGALVRSDVADNAPELVGRVARASGGRAVTFYAPFIMSDAAAAEALRRQVDVREALHRLDALTRAVVSVGAWRPGESTVHDALERPLQEELRTAGVQAEVSGLLLAADGSAIDALAHRTISISAAQLRRTPDVIAVAAGARRADAVAAVLRSGLVHGVVADAALARAVLEQGPARGRDRRNRLPQRVS